MYIIKNAVKNLIRNKSRNIIIGIIQIVTLTAVTIALIINSTSIAMIKDYKDSFDLEARIVEDWRIINASMESGKISDPNGSVNKSAKFTVPEISFEDYKKYADSKYVKDFMIKIRASYASDQLKRVPYNTQEGHEIVNIRGMTLDELKKFFGFSEKELISYLGESELKRIIEAKGTYIGDIYGCSHTSLLQEFSNGERLLSSGRMFQNDNECVISKNLAEYNGLQIGDAIQITGEQKRDTKVLKLTIVGLFDDFVEDVKVTATRTGLNDILVNLNVLEQSGFSYITPSSASFYLKDIEANSLFLKELRDKGLNKFLTLSSDFDKYKKAVKPVENMSKIAFTFMLAVLIPGAIIIILLSFAAIRERKYEIGVLRAIGMKKLKIATGVLYETIVLVTICLSISFACGSVLSQPITDKLLTDQADLTQDKGSNSIQSNSINNFTADKNIFNMSDSSQIQAVKISKDITINIYTILQIVAVAVVLGLISSLISILYITKFEPIRILSEQI